MAKKPRKALGRGLGALLEDSDSNKESSKKGNQDITDFSGGASINEISIEDIEVNPFQPRTDFDKQALEELAESIKVQGIIQPITVRKLSKDSYQLISGERRTQASKLAGLKSIPAYIRTADDQQMLEMALIENIQRENLNSIEIALSYQRLLTECDLKQEQLGDRVGKNRSTVNNYLRLLKLPPDIQSAIRDKKISMGHARAIINIDDIDKQLDVFNKILKDDLSVRKVEALVRELTSGEGKEKDKQAKAEMPYEAKQVQTKLSSHFGTKVGMKIDKNNKGEIKIPFLSKDDLNRILDILSVEL
ncbi:ParB/RepB/Spo0J family partition protein [Marivirga arenosa]|uniref:ParB/RepB/Spo0J family partition protein n=1 Tax=Marivirga arenosa TaxID=3059076 RepID=A0AA51ZV34_9BACT|nr:ParB/RepB/Spo0J family partition protein [Marivirga sp. BKB1-2]WNB17292.1 ParB/RepB/Spo0J family partition protein [Marivirga sp. BKB1-2]